MKREIMNDFECKLEELREAALSAGVPITRGAAYSYLLFKVKELAETHATHCTASGEEKAFRILELGTALGLTSVALAGVDSNILVTSVELDEERHRIASENVAAFNLSDRISLHLGDAGAFLEGHPCGERYHLVYIDGPKAQYLHHFEMSWRLLRLGGTIIVDNVDFYKESKRYKTINKRMVDFRNFVLHIGGAILEKEGMAVVTKNQASIEKEKEWKNRK